MIIKEIKGKISGLKVSYLGDGNNVANSLALSCALSGSDFTIGCPKGYEPNRSLFEKAKEIGKTTGAKIEIRNDPKEAAESADVVYTDVWVSMGEEKEKEAKEKLFLPYQVNSSNLENASKNYLFLHCLPAHRSLEVTSEIIDGGHSVVFQEAENRLHTSKGLIYTLLALD